MKLKFLLSLLLAVQPAFAAQDIGKEVSGTYFPGIDYKNNFVKNPDCSKNVLDIGVVDGNANSVLVKGTTAKNGRGCSITFGDSGDKYRWNLNTVDVGGSCQAVLWYKGSASNVKAYLADASWNQLSTPVTLNTSSASAPVAIANYNCGTTVYPVIEATAATSAVEYNWYYGPATNTTTGPLYLSRTTFTPTLTTGSGALSNYSSTGQYWVVGDTLYVDGQISFSGASSSFTQIFVDIPTGFTLNLPDTTVGRYLAGEVKMLDAGVLGYSVGPVAYESGNKFQLLYSVISTHTGNVPVAGGVIQNTIPFTFGSGDSINYSFKVPIVSPVINAINASQAEFNEQDCPTITGSWSTNTTYTCKWYRRKNRAYFDILVATAGAPTSATLTVNLPITVDMAKTTIPSGSGLCYGSALIRDFGSQDFSGITCYNSNTSVIPIVGNTASTYLTNNVITQAVPMTFASGDFVNMKFDVPVVGWIENPIPAIPQSVISGSNGVEGVYRARITCSSSSAIIDQSGSWVTSIANNSSGVCNITIASGIFSANPTCVANLISNSNGTLFAANAQTNSTTQVGVVGMGQAGGSTGFQTNYNFSIICMGPK